MKPQSEDMKLPNSLDDVLFPSPCPVSWESMEGNGCVRHCAECDRKVYNLSAMTADDALRFLQRQGAEACVQLTYRSDGSVVTADEPQSLAIRIGRKWRRFAAIVVTLVTLGLFQGCNANKTGNVEKTGSDDECRTLGGKTERAPD